MINKPRPGNWSPTDKTNTSLSFEYQTSLSTRHTDQIMKHTEADSWQHWSRHHTTRLLNPYLLSTGIVRKGLHPCIMARVLLPEFCVWEYWSPEPQLMSGWGWWQTSEHWPGAAEAEAALQRLLRGCERPGPIPDVETIYHNSLASQLNITEMYSCNILHFSSQFLAGILVRGMRCPVRLWTRNQTNNFILTLANEWSLSCCSWLLQILRVISFRSLISRLPHQVQASILHRSLC